MQVPFIPIEAINVTSSLNFTGIGQTSKLTPILVPENTNEDNIKLTSDNTAVATVDEEGNIRIRGYGKCAIKIQSLDNPSIIEKCEITVSDGVVRTASAPWVDLDMDTKSTILIFDEALSSDNYISFGQNSNFKRLSSLYSSATQTVDLNHNYGFYFDGDKRIGIIVGDNCGSLYGDYRYTDVWVNGTKVTIK